MYRAEKWIDGWLWLQSTPLGKWEKASTEQTIVALHERVAAVEGTREPPLMAQAERPEVVALARLFEGAIKNAAPNNYQCISPSDLVRAGFVQWKRFEMEMEITDLGRAALVLAGKS